MKGTIDTHGNLNIERGGILAPQFCPYKDQPCGDHCPKFGEPYPSEIKNKKSDIIKGFTLNLCTNDLLFFTELADERE